jgi:DedD protein
MAFFKSRKGGDETAAPARQPDSIEAMRRRAKHRLIGASVLVLLGVIGFPLLFDTQPRPISVDIPIEIPDRSKAKPLAVPAPRAAPTPAQPAAPAPAASTPVVAAPAPPPAASAPKIEARDDGAKALALLEGKDLTATPVTAEGRYVVQVGAFTDVTKARETRQKVEQAGLKTYTQVVETKDGKRIRVRVGPFANKAEADRAAEKVKGLDLQPAVLTL